MKTTYSSKACENARHRCHWSQSFRWFQHSTLKCFCSECADAITRDKGNFVQQAHPACSRDRVGWGRGQVTALLQLDSGPSLMTATIIWRLVFTQLLFLFSSNNTFSSPSWINGGQSWVNLKNQITCVSYSQYYKSISTNCGDALSSRQDRMC